MRGGQRGVYMRGGWRGVYMRGGQRSVYMRGGGRGAKICYQSNIFLSIMFDPLQLTNSPNFFSKFVKPGP